jgi:hypothetical protein
MKYMLAEKFHNSAFGSPAPALGARHVNSRIEIRPHATDRKAVRIE